MSSRTSRSKKLVTKTIDLLVKHQWLLNRSDAFTVLVQDLSKDDHIEVIAELLDRFLFLTPEQISLALNALADKFVVGWELPQDTTQLVAISFDEYADSGQAVMHALKPALSRRNANFPLINTVVRGGKKVNERPNIVLIDEFSGTGSTVVNRIRWLQDYSTQKGVPCNIFVALIACMESAKQVIEATGVQLYAVHVLKKGITGYHTDQELSDRLGKMDQIEDGLGLTWKNKPLPRRGYGGAEALYAADGWNLPNSVFPVFWWPRRVNDAVRPVLFSRLDP